MGVAPLLQTWCCLPDLSGTVVIGRGVCSSPLLALALVNASFADTPNSRVNAGFPVQCVEFLDGRTMSAINKGGLAGRQYKEIDSLFFKFQGTDASMSEVSKAVQKVVAKHGGKHFEFSKSDKEAQDLWQGRKAALWSVLSLKEDARVWTTDVW